MNEAEIIKGAREFLSDPQRWIKGRLLGDDNESACIVGALELQKHMAHDAERALEDHLPGGRGAYNGKDLRPLATFNDSPLTTHQDVLDLFDKTLADLGALGDAGVTATLSQRMRAAANVLEEVSELFDYLNPSLADWCAKSLRVEAEQLEDE